MQKSVCVAALCKEISAFQRGVFCNMRTKELKEFIFVRSSFFASFASFYMRML